MYRLLIPEQLLRHTETALNALMMSLIGPIYAVLIVGVICFQIALICGAPWGRMTQGGQHDGPLPQSGRIIAAFSIFLLLFMALSILSALGNWPHWPRWTGWVTVVVSVLSAILNWITPSRPERLLWGPITTVLLVLAAGAMMRGA